MAGGTWSSQNKVRPGVYIRFRSAAGTGLTVGERGVVAICEPLSWGPVGAVMEIEAGESLVPYIGYDLTDPQALFLREMFKGTNRTAGPRRVLLYRPNAAGAASATATVGSLTATAKYPGVRGNDITVIVEEELDDTCTVSTVVDGEVVDTQTGVTTISGLTANGWVTFSGTGELTATTGTPLTGGADGTVATGAYSAFLTAIEPYQFDIIAYDGADAATMGAMAAFVRRMADESGVWSQLVAANFASNPDSELVVNVMSGVTLDDGTVLTSAQTVWWAAGALAGAAYNQSLTYASYPGAVAVSPVLTNSGYVNALNGGQFVLFAQDGAVKVEQDIDTLVTLTEDRGKPFRKNRVIRLCATIANDIYRQFSANFIGVVNNNAAGRSRFKAVIVGYLLDIQGNQGIQNFSADDVEVLPGTDIDAIVVNVALQATDAVEKIYMSIEVS